MNIVPRTEIGLPARVTNINRITSRPLLRDGLDLCLVHYTGVTGTYAGKDPAAVIRSVHRWRANEYSYCISLDGRIFEFAGQYQSAHAKGFNDRSYGVLMINGTRDACTDAQVEAFRFLIGCLKWTQRIKTSAWIVPHQYVAATACPGPVMERYTELAAA